MVDHEVDDWVTGAEAGDRVQGFVTAAGTRAIDTNGVEVVPIDIEVSVLVDVEVLNEVAAERELPDGICIALGARREDFNCVAIADI